MSPNRNLFRPDPFAPPLASAWLRALLSTFRAPPAPPETPFPPDPFSFPLRSASGGINSLMGAFYRPKPPTLSLISDRWLRKWLVWEKGEIIAGCDPQEWRLDDFGNVIQSSAYGDRTSHYGWEIDHILPVALGGLDTLDNLRPLYWPANVARWRGD